MFYKFSSLTGRLVPSSQSASLSPQGIEPLKKFDSKLTFESKSVVTTRTVAQLAEAVKVAEQSGPVLGRVPSHSAYKRVMDLQQLFLKPDGLLVWQKRGLRDRVPYVLAMGACVVGLGICGNVLYRMAFPHSRN